MPLSLVGLDANTGLTTDYIVHPHLYTYTPMKELRGRIIWHNSSRSPRGVMCRRRQRGPWISLYVIISLWFLTPLIAGLQHAVSGLHCAGTVHAGTCKRTGTSMKNFNFFVWDSEDKAPQNVCMALCMAALPSLFERES
jgi:hypothetical protein